MKKVCRWLVYMKPIGRKYPLISWIYWMGGRSSLVLLSVTIIFTAFTFQGTSQDFFRLENINEIRIDIEVSNWETKLHSMKQIRSDERLPAILFLNGERFDSIGIRYKGNSSYYYTVKKDLSKRPFNIKSDEFRDDMRFDKYAEKIKMSNGFRDPSFVREALAYEIARKYMPAPLANFSKLYINDVYYGLYTSVESVEGRFLKKTFRRK